MRSPPRLPSVSRRFSPISSSIPPSSPKWRLTSTSGLPRATRLRPPWPRPVTPHLLPLVQYWRERLVRLRELFRAVGQDIIGAYRALETAGRLEIIGSAATHGYLPLLARDESIRLQLAVGVSEHRRIFGRSPNGCWLPECAYRPRGPWEPWPTAPKTRNAPRDR